MGHRMQVIGAEAPWSMFELGVTMLTGAPYSKDEAPLDNGKMRVRCVVFDRQWS